MPIVNKAKERLKEGKPIYGVGLTFPSAAIVELCAYAGFDYVRIDCEHGPMDPMAVEDMVRAAEAAGITPLARPPANNFHEVLRLLDAGVQGVLTPHIETKADAEQAAKAARYYPQGERGMAGARWTHYGTGGPMAELIKQANESVLLMALIESATGVQNLDDILAVPGIDLVQVGHMDLSQSLGLPAQITHPTVQEHIDRILKKSLAAGKYVGMIANDADSARQLVERGFRLIEFSAAQLYVGAGRSLLKDVPH
ncbi:MAG: HpcH/HpaI aldolase family protein [Chloroflexota bacterium]